MPSVLLEMNPHQDSEVLSSPIIDIKPSLEEFPDMAPLYKGENKDQEKNKNKMSAVEKNGNHYKDTKEYTFVTQGPNGTGPEISLRATTDVNFVLRNPQSRIRTATAKHIKKLPEKTTVETTVEEHFDEIYNHFQKPTRDQNEPEFWTVLQRALNETPPREKDYKERDQLFKPVPSSDVNVENKEPTEELESVKIKLMLSISVMSLLLFLAFLTLCLATLYKMKKLNSKSRNDSNQYSVNPELAEISYFHPSEGVSDTSFSKSAESSTFWGNNSSEFRKSGLRKPKPKSMADVVPEGFDETGAYEDAREIQEEPNEETTNE